MTVEPLPPAVGISHAVVSDVDDVALLFDQYRQFYGQVSDLAGARSFLKERIENSESVILLARRDEQAVGFVQLYPSFSSVSMRKIWVLNDLFVIPEARRLGIAAALMDRAVAFATESGAVRLVLATARNNAAARALYVRQGWREELEFVHYLCVCGDRIE